jgi:membrane-associated phospholipid phosphatase
MSIRKNKFKITSAIFAALLVSTSIFAKGNVERQGDALQYLIPAIALGSTFFYEKGDEAKQGRWQFLKSFATAQLTTEVLKKSINKTRPNGNCCDSFPSGHTSAAFMGASFIQKRYGWKVAIPAYIGASYVGYSRVQSNKHYTVDVLAGAAIGIASSFYFTKSYHGMTITPVAYADSVGISLSKSW